jgi:hypothetical protein
MADEQEEQGKSMYDKIMSVPGAKPIGKQEGKKKAGDHILKSYEDRPSSRDESIMENFADSVNKPAKSIGERLEGQ